MKFHNQKTMWFRYRITSRSISHNKQKGKKAKSKSIMYMQTHLPVIPRWWTRHFSHGVFQPFLRDHASRSGHGSRRRGIRVKISRILRQRVMIRRGLLFGRGFHGFLSRAKHSRNIHGSTWRADLLGLE